MARKRRSRRPHCAKGTAYIMREMQTIHDQRKGEVICARSLSGAKRIAKRNQFFEGTVLTLESAATGHKFAWRDSRGWHDYD